MAKQTLGSTVRHNVTAVSARLNGSPDSAEEWQTIARQLRQASDAARKIAKLATRMEAAPTLCDRKIDYWLAERYLDTDR